ncbi:MAG: IS110 family transposase [Chitinophagaceae bacterium]
MKTKQSTAVVEPIGKLQKIDFTNKTLYVGIDVHKLKWQVAVFFEGIVLSNVSMGASAEAMIIYLRKHYVNANFHCVYECGAWGFTLCRQLWAAGMECMVVNPGDIPGTDKERKSKTDPIDARKMARHLAAGLLQCVHVPSEKSQKQRSIIRFRKKLWGDLVRAKNRLKSELKFQGIDVPVKYDNPHWSKNFMLWIEQQANKDEDLRDTVLLMLEEVKALRLLLLKTERKLRELMWSEDYKYKSELLRTIPGVGPLTAMLFLLEVGDVKRFKTFDALNRFVGFCPDSNSSGETETHTGITKRRHKTLRSALVESAWQLIRRDAAMLLQYQELKKRMKGQKAIIRIARKLLRRIRAVMLSERVYVTGIGGNVTSQQVDAPPLPTPKPKGRPKQNAAAGITG